MGQDRWERCREDDTGAQVVEVAEHGRVPTTKPPVAPRTWRRCRRSGRPLFEAEVLDGSMPWAPSTPMA